MVNRCLAVNFVANRYWRRLSLFGWALFAVVAWASEAAAVDRVTLRHEGRQVQIDGQLLVTAEDGGLLVLAPDGVMWTVKPTDLVEHTKDDAEFAPLARKDLGKRLLADLPEGFEIHETAHYLICHNTSRAYAQWSGGLLERLYLAFTNFWSRRGFELHEPQFPLVAWVYGSRELYSQQGRGEVGEGIDQIIGYYSFHTNRITTYDLTGVQALRRPNDRRGSTSEINQMLARPEAEWMVATVVHEATHQIAFNCGLQTRYSDVPFWVSEGVAMYFETPDLSSSKSWRNIGGVNRPRLATFKQILSRRPAGSLESLITDDKRFRDTKQAGDAYAEAWALTYFLIRQRPKQYDAYLKTLSTKGQLVWDKPQTRLQEFKQAFGDNLETLDAEFVRTMSRLQ